MKYSKLLALLLTLMFIGIFSLKTEQVQAQTENAGANIEHCGTLTTNETWQASNNVHIVTCNVVVPVGTVLTIEAGAIIKFYRDRSIYVDGKLYSKQLENPSFRSSGKGSPRLL